jgi:NADP-dependent 3-hydroxy acid dehydrogenase YdfG
MTALNGKTALVTGAGSGIGRAIAVALARQGVRLILSGRTPAKLVATAEQLGPDADSVAHPGDLCQREVLNDVAGLVQERFGALDMLIHAAGDYGAAPLAETTWDHVGNLLNSNLIAPFELTRLLMPALLAAGGGDLVFINSSQGLTASAGSSAYAASKQALKALADAVRAEWNEQGVRVLSVYCGKTATPMQEKVQQAKGGDYAAMADKILQADDISAIVIAALALPRTAEVTDLQIRPRQKI